MSSLLPRALRLLKFGAVAGALVGVGRMVMMRRRRSEVDESSWPTIAETAAQNGQPVDETGTGEAGDDGSGDGDDPGDGDDAGDGSGEETDKES